MEDEIEDDGFITVYPRRKSDGFGWCNAATVFVSPIGIPQTWFAWYPVRNIFGRLVWLKKIRRVKMRYKLWSADNVFWYEYHGY